MNYFYPIKPRYVVTTRNNQVDIKTPHMKTSLNLTFLNNERP